MLHLFFVSECHILQKSFNGIIDSIQIFASLIVKFWYDAYDTE
ncbi:MAG: hypothetical protein RRY72_08305 [Bacteroides sp.]